MLGTTRLARTSQRTEGADPENAVPAGKRYFAIALGVLLLLGFLATSVVSYLVAHDSLRDQLAEESLPLTSDNIYSEIERDLLRSILISSLMAHDTFVRDWALSGEDDPQRIQRYLREIQDEHDTTTAFFVSERTRRYYHPSGVLKTVSADDPDDAWYFRVRDLDEPYEINLDTDTADPSRLNIFINYRVLDYAGDYLGATGVGLAVDSVAALIDTYQRRYGRLIYFTDREGRIQLHGEDFEGPRSLHERPGMRRIATSLLSSPATQTSFRGPAGERVYVNTRLVPELDWYLVVQQTGVPAGARILDTLLLNVGVALALAALVLVGGWYTVRGYQLRLETMATTDKLTGCTSRQVFAAVFDDAARRARRDRRALSLVALDLDEFKPVNDNHGHVTGDSVLRAVTHALTGVVREADTVCRWGGDEFLILLKDCPHGEATRLAERMRAAVAELRVHFRDHEIRVTASIGVTEARPDESLESLIVRCDEAMYRAKHDGGNRIVAE